MKFETVLIKGFIGFFTLFILIRIIGKKQLGELSFFNYITGIAMGNIAGDMIIHKDVRLIDAVIGMIIWALLTIILGFISLKHPKIRTILNGEPAIVIKKGVIDKAVLASLKINMDDLAMLLRNNNIFSIKDVDYAIMETNGQLSVLKKPEKEFPAKKDLMISVDTRRCIPTEIIVDGNIIYRNLKEVSLDEKWLGQQLKQLNITNIKDIFYAQLQEDGSLYVIKR